MINTLEDKRKLLNLDQSGAVLSDLLCSFDLCKGIKAEHILNEFHLSKHLVFCFYRNNDKIGGYYHVDVYEKDLSSEYYFYYCGFEDSYYSASHDYSWYALLSYYKDTWSGMVLFNTEDYIEDQEMISAFGKL